MNDGNKSTEGDAIVAIGNVLNEINQNRKTFDTAQATRYENFVSDLTSDSDRIAWRQL